MRQLWERRPARLADKAQLLFTIIAGCLIWLAAGGLSLVQAQDPGDKDKDAATAAKVEAAAAPRVKTVKAC